MGQYTSYYFYQKYEKRGEGDWVPVYPNEYSVDGNGTMPLSVKNENDPACGYNPSGTIYRWINMDISQYWICDECTTPPTPTGYTTQYLTFVAQESGSFSFVSFEGTSGNTVLYSLDNGSTWTSLASGASTPTVNTGNKIIWKGTGQPSPFQNNRVGAFSSTGQFEVEGNIMSLLFDDNFIGQTSLSGYSDAFGGLFNGCSGLTSAENLVLPATTLASNCYGFMFANCTSLTSAPQLSATTLTSGCYNSMFQYCTSLTSAPELPATTLAGSCYAQMFDGCTSLTTAPVLPATTLAEDCYISMFLGCTSLTSAPVLSATTLAKRCYGGMFYNCTSLSAVTCLATDISASGCTQNWLYNVSSSGTFTKAASMNDWTTGVSGIPTNWTVQNYVS